MDKLKPCPICGRCPITIEVGNLIGWSVRIQCSHYLLEDIRIERSGLTRKGANRKAVKAWNTDIGDPT